ncbi:MAG: XisI protein [Scytonema sp. PMC 1069.18]|nr:XisI protein [Scytonema sp. PMC 1069.18]MEC4886583.1 XisI protein [Scytonema sp. PMC 1070.18]
MDKVAKYREHIQALLTLYASDDIADKEVEVQLVFDTERDHYQWMNVGWEGFNRIYRCIVHFDIKEGKIWLQQNLTDENPPEDLVTMGVPREDIVLGLQPPYKRQYTDYGVA